MLPMRETDVLVVDDDGLIAWAVERELTAHRFQVDIAQTGAEALERVRSGRYRVALLDIHLPDLSGLTVLAEIRRLSPDTRVVVISSDATDANIQRAQDVGAWQFVEKPFALSDIGRVVSGLLREGEERRVRTRESCRVPLRLLLVESEDLAACADLRAVIATSVDASDDGLRLQTAYPLRRGQWVRVFPEAHLGTVHSAFPQGAQAEVIWVRSEGADFEAGLRYAH